MVDEPIGQPRKQIVLDLDWLPEPLQGPRTVIFLREGKGRIGTATVEHGYSVFEAGEAAGVYIPTTCGGKGTCGRCRVRGEGDARPPTYIERQFISPVDLAAHVRLACRLRVEGDMAVTVLRETDERRQ